MIARPVTITALARRPFGVCASRRDGEATRGTVCTGQSVLAGDSCLVGRSGLAAARRAAAATGGSGRAGLLHVAARLCATPAGGWSSYAFGAAGGRPEADELAKLRRGILCRATQPAGLAEATGNVRAAGSEGSSDRWLAPLVGRSADAAGAAGWSTGGLVRRSPEADTAARGSAGWRVACRPADRAGTAGGDRPRAPASGPGRHDYRCATFGLDGESPCRPV